MHLKERSTEQYRSITLHCKIKRKRQRQRTVELVKWSKLKLLVHFSVGRRCAVLKVMATTWWTGDRDRER